MATNVLKVFWVAWFTGAVWAEGSIVTDGTVGPRGSVTRDSGNQYSIPESLGTRAGNNLFHSFQTFNIDTGETATFTGSSSIQNVVSRVTGGAASTIDGTLRSQVGNADFYFINPAGVVLGVNAQIDVPAAFHVSTADEVRFPGGQAFRALTPNGSSLSVAHPAAFGFLGSSVVNNGLLRVDGAQLRAKSGQTIDAVAGQISLASGALLNAPGGEVRMVARQGAGDVSVQRTTDGVLPLPDAAPAGPNAGRLTIADSGVVTSGDGGGRAAVWGGSLTVSGANAALTTSNSGVSDAGREAGIRIRADRMSVDAATIGADASAQGRGGDISVEVGTTAAFVNGGNLASRALSSGSAGAIRVTAGLDVNVDGRNTLGLTGFASDAVAGSQGDAGSVVVSAGRDLTVAARGTISSSTFGAGQGGSIDLAAGRDLIADGRGALTSIHSDTEDGSGDAGSVTIAAARDVVVVDSAQISTEARSSSGRSGSVEVTAGRDLRLAGRGTGLISSNTQGSSTAGGNVAVTAKRDVLIGSGGAVSSLSFGSGRGGSVAVVSGRNLSVVGIGNPDGSPSAASGINANALAGGQAAGDVFVKARGAISVVEGGTISSSSFNSGDAGSVEVLGNRISVVRGSSISASAFGRFSDASGRVTIKAFDAIAVRDNSSLLVQSEAEVPGDAEQVAIGRLNVSAPRVILSDSTIASSSSGNVAAGDIAIRFGQRFAADSNSAILTTANTGDGGDVTMLGPDGTLLLSDSGITTSVVAGLGNGGDIRVQAKNLVLDSGQIEANANSGRGGRINLAVQALLPSSNLLNGRPFGSQAALLPGPRRADPNNVIQAVSTTGVRGTVSLTAPQLNLSGALANVGNPSFDSSRVRPDRCEAGSASGLRVESGRGALPSKGDDLLID